MGLLQDKVAVVTGGTSGIGEATVRLMIEEGAKVIFAGRNRDKGAGIVSDMGANADKLFYVFCDVSSEESVRRMNEEIRKITDHIDVLFNNAGVMKPSMEIERMPYEDWKSTFTINVDGMFLVTKMLKDLVYRCKGCIINNASIAGLQSYVAGRSYAYSASKAAVIQFTRQMAKNYAEDGIRVNCICPGIIDTPILGDRDRAEYAKRVPLGYVAEPKEVAKAVVMLASDYASYVTGAVIPVDGGVSI